MSCLNASAAYSSARSLPSTERTATQSSARKGRSLMVGSRTETAHLCPQTPGFISVGRTPHTKCQSRPPTRHCRVRVAELSDRLPLSLLSDDPLPPAPNREQCGARGSGRRTPPVSVTFPKINARGRWPILLSKSNHCLHG